jgi:hypothetical protein
MNDVSKYLRAHELAFSKWQSFGNRLIRAGNVKWGNRVHRRSNLIWMRRHQAAMKEAGPLPAAPLSA